MKPESARMSITGALSLAQARTWPAKLADGKALDRVVRHLPMPQELLVRPKGDGRRAKQGAVKGARLGGRWLAAASGGLLVEVGRARRRVERGVGRLDSRCSRRQARAGSSSGGMTGDLVRTDDDDGLLVRRANS